MCTIVTILGQRESGGSLTSEKVRQPQSGSGGEPVWEWEKELPKRLTSRRFDVSRAGGKGMATEGDRYQGFWEKSLFVNQVRWRKSMIIMYLRIFCLHFLDSFAVQKTGISFATAGGCQRCIAVESEWGLASRGFDVSGREDGRGFQCSVIREGGRDSIRGLTPPARLARWRVRVSESGPSPVLA